MNDPKTVITRLCELTALECKVDALSENGIEVGRTLAGQIATARGLIPTAVLGHHDRLRARGKKSVASVRNGVCGACHLRLPISHAISLRPDQDIEVCDNCGVFLYVDAAAAPVPVTTTVRKRSRAKSSARKAEVVSSVSEHSSLQPE